MNITNYLRYCFAGLFVILLSLLPIHAVKVHTIGDSTMADYDESSTDKRGWCTYLGSFFDAEYVTVNNRGKSGADTRQFYTSANLWNSVKGQMTAGDYLLIQFAHNDEGVHTNGTDNLDYAAYCTAHGLEVPAEKRGTNPQTTYRDFLRAFIDEARELGVNPVLVGPICRKYFSGNNITRKGQHDLGDSFYKIVDNELLTNQSVPADDHSMDYVYAMKVVAQEKNVPFIDLTEATRQLYVEYGDALCTQLLFCSGDKTHTATLGANLIARSAARLLKDAGILSDYITIPTSITAMPSTLNVGEVYSGVQVNREVLLTGFELSPQQGILTVTAPDGILISTDNINFSSTLYIEYQGGTLFQRIYVHAIFDNAGANELSITVTSDVTQISIPVSASVISLEGGADVKVTWTIGGKPIPAPVIEGPVVAQMTLSHMTATDTKNDFTDGTTMVRFHNADDSGAKTAWPAGEIDENAMRYIDFAITAPTTMDIRLTGISMTLAGYSTGSMCCHINTGYGDDMDDVQTIYERRNFTHATPEDVNITTTLTIEAGQTLHIRLLPWHETSSVGSGKYICVKNVVIEGQAFEADGTALTQLQQDANVVSVRYYSVDGKHLSQPAKGIIIISSLMSNGDTITEKILAK